MKATPTHESPIHGHGVEALHPSLLTWTCINVLSLAAAHSRPALFFKDHPWCRLEDEEADGGECWFLPLERTRLMPECTLIMRTRPLCAG